MTRTPTPAHPSTPPRAPAPGPNPPSARDTTAGPAPPKPLQPALRRLTRAQRLLAASVVAGALAIAGIGFTGSYTAVRKLATRKGFAAYASLYPLGIDAGICVLLALDLLLAWIRIPYPLLRHTAWLLTAATITFNAAAAWPDPLGVGMHAVIPMLFVITVEAARHAISRLANITTGTHMEGVRASRWLLAPAPTFLLWRRMKLWELRTYQQAITLEQERLLYQTKLHARYGRAWRRKAPVEALLPLHLARYGIPLDKTVPPRLAPAAEPAAPPAAPPPQPAQPATAEPRTADTQQPTTDAACHPTRATSTTTITPAATTTSSHASQVAPASKTAAPPNKQSSQPSGPHPARPKQTRDLDQFSWFRTAPRMSRHQGDHSPTYTPAHPYKTRHEYKDQQQQQVPMQFARPATKAHHQTAPPQPLQPTIRGNSSQPALTQLHQTRGTDSGGTTSPTKPEKKTPGPHPNQPTSSSEPPTPDDSPRPASQTPETPEPAPTDHTSRAHTHEAAQPPGPTTVDRYYTAWHDFLQQHGREPDATELSTHLAQHGLHDKQGHPIKPKTLARYLLNFRIYTIWSQHRALNLHPDLNQVAKELAQHSITGQYNKPITHAHLTQHHHAFEHRWQAQPRHDQPE
ncbi:DUF2637 domain-containing protein [Streptomyces sp. NPDC046915]|uniref:DUF2637 domain-containing protein n=1 Tax=Streptomyces sp. NPDC046915 TaxID=3155257 RepID=UPI0033D95790